MLWIGHIFFLSFLLLFKLFSGFGYFFSAVQFSHAVVSDSFWSHGLQYSRLPCPSPIPGAYSNSCPLNRWCHPTISSSVIPFSCLQSFPKSGSFKWVSLSKQVAKVLKFQLQHQSFQWIFRTDFIQDGLVGYPCCPRDSQKSSPTPRFKSINFWHSAFFTVQLTYIHDHWKNQSCE